MSTVTLEAAEWQRLKEAAEGGTDLDPANATDARIISALAAVQPPPPPPPPPAEHALDLKAINASLELEVADAPVGKLIDFALCPTKDGGTSTTPPLYEPKNVPVGGKIKAKPGYEWVDAKVQGATEWWSKTHGRIKLAVEGSAPPPPPPPPPGPSAVGYHAGGCFGGWTRSQEIADAKKLSSKPIVRLENPSDTKSFTDAGVNVIYLNSGGTSLNVPHLSDEAREHRSLVMQHGLDGSGNAERHKRYGYSSGGVKSLSTTTVVNDAVADVKKHPGIVVYEYLNEPGGDWFWGSGASSAENAAAYARQSRAIAEAFVAQFGSAAPLVAVSMDGGHAGDNTWGKNVLKADPTLFKHPLIVPTNHPYDGSSANPSSTLVRWHSVEETRSLTGKWPLVTEYGRPLMASTGDSPKSTESQQAAADGAMAKRCAEVGTIYTAYGYRGDSSPCYAIFKGSDEPRPAVGAIRQAG